MKSCLLNIKYNKNRSFSKETHHSDDLEVFQVRPLCGQNLFGNEVGFISGIPLKEERDTSSKTE